MVAVVLGKGLKLLASMYYLSQGSQGFELFGEPLLLEGSALQKRVWPPVALEATSDPKGRCVIQKNSRSQGDSMLWLSAWGGFV